MRLMVDLEYRNEWYAFAEVWDKNGKPTGMTAIAVAVYAEGAD